MTVQTRSMTQQLKNKIQGLPKKKCLHYKWVKENNMIFTEPQILQMRLNIDDNRKVIFYKFVYGYNDEDLDDKRFAVAPEGYYWKENIEYEDEVIKRKIIEGTLNLDFYRDAMCQSFVLAKN